MRTYLFVCGEEDTNNMGMVESNTPVDSLGFTNRTRNSLRRAHIDTYGDLIHASEL